MKAKEENIVIGKSGLHRKGLIAVKNMRKGENIFTVEGVKIKFLINNQRQAAKAGLNWIGWDKNEWIDPVSYGLYINHSCMPNAGIAGRKKVVAIKNIRSGEEVTMDYSLSEADIFWNFRCNCRSGNCRKHVRSIQFLPLDIYKKNLRYIPAYFRRVFLRFNISKFRNRADLRKAWVDFIEKGFKV